MFLKLLSLSFSSQAKHGFWFWALWNEPVPTKMESGMGFQDRSVLAGKRSRSDRQNFLVSLFFWIEI
jgi:hypothetical protein